MNARWEGFANIPHRRHIDRFLPSWNILLHIFCIWCDDMIVRVSPKPQQCYIITKPRCSMDWTLKLFWLTSWPLAELYNQFDYFKITCLLILWIMCPYSQWPSSAVLIKQNSKSRSVGTTALNIFVFIFRRHDSWWCLSYYGQYILNNTLNYKMWH